MKYKERDELVASLREMADFFENNPKAIELPLPDIWISTYVTEYHRDASGYINYREIDEFATRLKVRQIAKAFGSCEKDYHGGTFAVSKKFGMIKVRYETSRQAICRKVVKEVKHHPAEVREIPARDEEIVEWVCDDPILATK